MDQSEGTEPEISDLLKRIVKIGAISFEHSRTGVLKYFKSLIVHGQVGPTNSLVRTKEVLVRTFKIDKGKGHY